MSIVITATAITKPDNSIDSIEHSTKAGLQCLENAGLTVEDVDYLVNIGVYRHHNMCEPSICALIQHSMEMCPDPRKYPVKKNVFSFDLNNGACGALNAITVLGAQLTARGLDHALIVGSDCHPSGKAHSDYPFSSMGSAMLISRVDESNKGFSPVVQEVDTPGFDGQRGFCDLDKFGTESRNSIEIDRAPDYLERLEKFAVDTVGRYIKENNIDTDKVKLICSEPGPGFANDLAAGLGIPSDAVISTFDQYGDVHTAAAALGYHQAKQDDRINKGDQILFVNAGSGLTVSSCLYTC